MDELQRRALARLPMSEEEVRAAYHCRDVDRLPEYEYLPGGGTRCSVTPEVVGKLLRIRGQLCASVATLCESHERLRAELDGTAALLRDAEAENVRLQAGLQRIEALIGTSGFTPRDVRTAIADSLAGGDDDGTT